MARTQLLYPVAKINDKPVAGLYFRSSLTVPWRTLGANGEAFRGQVTALAGYRSTGVWEIFKGELDTPKAVSSGQGEATARGLPALRKQVKAQFFQGADLQTVLNWIGSQVSQPLRLTVQGPARRHYSVTAGSAWSAIKAALLSWRRLDYVAIELDDYALYIGPEVRSPHATAPVQATLEHQINIYRLKASAKGAQVVIPAYPWLRVGHRVTLAHPVVSGRARIVEAVLEMNRRDTLNTLEVEMT